MDSELICSVKAEKVEKFQVVVVVVVVVSLS